VRYISPIALQTVTSSQSRLQEQTGTQVIPPTTVHGRDSRVKETCSIALWTCLILWLEFNGQTHSKECLSQQAVPEKEL
jgi:hypothetical protein